MGEKTQDLMELSEQKTFGVCVAENSEHRTVDERTVIILEMRNDTVLISLDEAGELQLETVVVSGVER